MPCNVHTRHMPREGMIPRLIRKHSNISQMTSSDFGVGVFGGCYTFAPHVLATANTAKHFANVVLSWGFSASLHPASLT